jgi:hypothetical protein
MVFKRTTPVTALDLDSSDIPDASASSKGGVQLAGDLGGTASAPTVPGLASKQPLDSDLTTIAGLTPGAGNVLAADGSGWFSKTYAALKTAMAFVKGDVGLGNVDNTSDANKPVSTAAQTALDARRNRFVDQGAAKTASYSVAAWHSTTYDVSAGSVSQALPASPTAGDEVEVFVNYASTTNALTLTGTGGPFTVLPGNGVTVRWTGSAWVERQDRKTVTALDSRYSAGVLDPRNDGAKADGTTNDGAAFQAMYDRVAAGRYTNATLSSNGTGSKVIEIPAGVYLITDANAFMRDVSIARTQGLTIRGAGRGITNIIFSPGSADQYLLDNNDDWLHLTFEDISFVSTVSTASFMKSTSSGGAQSYVFNRCNWSGTWKYGVDLQGSNSNSEMTWFHCSIAGNWTAFLYSASSGTSDQFLNYNFYACQSDMATGNYIDMAKGGNINVWGGSLTHGGNGTQSSSSAQCFFRLRGGDHASGVQRLLVIGARVEHKHENSQLINCEWKTGNVSFIGCDTESLQSLLTTPTNVVQAEFGGSGDTMPVISFDGCSLMGKHKYTFGANEHQYRRNVRYVNCSISIYATAAEFITYTDNSSGNLGSTTPIEFVNCRSVIGGSSVSYKNMFDCTIGWQSSRNAVVQKRQVSVKRSGGQLPYNGDPTVNVTLPLNAVITRVYSWKPAGGASSSTNFTYTLTDADGLQLAQAVGDGSTAWSAGYSWDSGNLRIPLTTNNKRTLTLTAANIANAQGDNYFIIEYIA